MTYPCDLLISCGKRRLWDWAQLYMILPLVTAEIPVPMIVVNQGPRFWLQMGSAAQHGRLFLSHGLSWQETFSVVAYSALFVLISQSPLQCQRFSAHSLTKAVAWIPVTSSWANLEAVPFSGRWKKSAMNFEFWENHPILLETVRLMSVRMNSLQSPQMKERSCCEVGVGGEKSVVAILFCLGFFFFWALVLLITPYIPPIRLYSTPLDPRVGLRFTRDHSTLQKQQNGEHKLR